VNLTFELRRSYGKDRFYPTNEAARLVVESLMARRCLETFHLVLLSEAGAEIRVDGTLLEFSGAPEVPARTK
jgi:hypothetical protein